MPGGEGRRMDATPRLSIVIPVLNEADGIVARLIADLFQHKGGFGAGLICQVVNQLLFGFIARQARRSLQSGILFGHQSV